MQPGRLRDWGDVPYLIQLLAGNDCKPLRQIWFCKQPHNAQWPINKDFFEWEGQLYLWGYGSKLVEKISSRNKWSLYTEPVESWFLPLADAVALGKVKLHISQDFSGIDVLWKGIAWAYWPFCLLVTSLFSSIAKILFLFYLPFMTNW